MSLTGSHEEIIRNEEKMVCNFNLRTVSLEDYFESEFSQTHKIGNIGTIANFVFPYVCSFPLYLYHIMLVNVKISVSGYKRITFQGCKLH